MRVDEVRSATQLLTDTTTASELISNQFRMAVYSKGNDCSAVRLTTIASLSSVKSGHQHRDPVHQPSQHHQQRLV
jgi:hypothetical protein